VTECRKCGCLCISSGDDLCTTCERRGILRAYEDPRTSTEFIKVLRQRAEARRYDQLSDLIPVVIPNLVCVICHRPLDDHLLTYNQHPYPIGLCPKDSKE